MPDPEKKVEKEGLDYDAFLKGEAVSTDPPPADPPPSDPPPADPPPADPPPSTEVKDPLWNQFKTNYPEAEIPEAVLKGEELTAEQNFKLMNDAVLGQITTPAEDDDEFIKSYKDARVQEGFEFDRWIDDQNKISNILNMPSRDFLKEVYRQRSKNEDTGWTEEDIETHLNGMTKIAIDNEANQQKNSIRSIEQKKFDSYKQSQDRKLETDELPKVVAEAETMLNNYITSRRSEKTIDGFRFEDDDREEYFKALPEFTKKKIIEVDNRKVIASEADLLLHNILNDPEKSMQVLPWLYLTSKGKLKGFSSKLVESVRDTALEQLSSEPDKSGGDPGDHGFDPEAFNKASQQKK